MCWLFMVSKKKIDDNLASGLVISLSKPHFSRFVADFYWKYCPILGIEENRKKGGGPSYPLKYYLFMQKQIILKVPELLNKWHKYYDTYNFVL